MLWRVFTGALPPAWHQPGSMKDKPAWIMAKLQQRLQGCCGLCSGSLCHLHGTDFAQHLHTGLACLQCACSCR